MFIKWYLSLFMLCIGGGGGGGSSQAARQQEAEEARKSALRDKINALYGVGGASPQNFMDEEAEISKGLRDYYGDEQKKAYERAERQMRFGAANTGNIGSTTYADAESELAEKNRLGSTRIEEAVQRAINGLRGSRESTRLNAINLVNAGSGEDAVQSAMSGLRGVLDTAKSANRENLTSDLFENLAFTKVAGDSASRDELLRRALYPQKTSATYTVKPDYGTVHD